MEALQFAILGLGTGAIFALLAQSIVAVNLGSGVLNFSAGATGMLGAYTFFALRGDGLAPGILALVLALAASAAVGAATHLLIMRPLASASLTSRIVVTLGLMATLLEVVTLITSNHGATEFVTSPLPAGTVQIGSQIVIGTDRLVLAAIACGVTALLVLAQRRTRLGLATCAMAENRLVAASMGWSPNVVGATVWAVGSAVAALAAILAASISGLSASSLTFLVIPAMAAALIGGFRSFTWTLIGAMLIGIAQSELSRYVSSPGWQTAAPLLAIVCVLIVRGRGLPARTEPSERRPAVGSGRVRPAILVGAAVAGLLLTLGPVTWQTPISTTLLFALIVLSVIVVTGYAGQLSLAQVAMAGLGAYFTALLSVKFGVPLVVAIIGAVVACMPIAVLVALPALRTRGYNLAIATISLATAIDSLIINNPERLSSIIGKDLGPLTIFGLDLSAVTNPAAFTVTALVVFAVTAVAVANLRRGRSGRRLLAIRSNERAAASLGISVPGVKLYAFWLSATIAALGGALMEARFGTGDLTSFQVNDNINVVLYATIGGIGWIAGAILGALGVPGGVTAEIVSSFTLQAGSWLVLLGGVGAILIIMQSPDGAAPLLRRQFASLASWARRGAGRQSRLEQAAILQERHARRGPGDNGTQAALPRRSPRTLEVRDIAVRYGRQVALNDVSLTLKTGEIVGLIGPNGAGKSTLIDVITGFQRPQAGTLLLDGRAIDRLGPARRARAGVSRSFQALELFEDMTVLENLRTAADRTSAHHYLTDLAWPKASPLTDATHVAIQEFQLEPVLHRFPPELDFGTRRLVAIARSLSSGPSLILLDEPACGLDRRERRELASLIKRVASDWGVGVLLVEHDVQLVFSVCERVVALDQGRVIAAGPADAVHRSEAVVTAYLGDRELESKGPDPEAQLVLGAGNDRPSTARAGRRQCRTFRRAGAERRQPHRGGRRGRRDARGERRGQDDAAAYDRRRDPTARRAHHASRLCARRPAASPSAPGRQVGHRGARDHPRTDGVGEPQAGHARS